jgi:hypothetical protein
MKLEGWLYREIADISCGSKRTRLYCMAPPSRVAGLSLATTFCKMLLSPLFGGLSAHTTINSTLATPSLLVTATVGSRIPQSVEKAITAPPTGSSSPFLTSAVIVTAPPIAVGRGSAQLDIPENAGHLLREPLDFQLRFAQAIREDAERPSTADTHALQSLGKIKPGAAQIRDHGGGDYGSAGWPMDVRELIDTRSPRRSR